MRKLSDELRAAERERAYAAASLQAAAEPNPGEIWLVAPSVTGRDGVRVLEHSRAPVEVVVLERREDVVEVAPISYDIELAGEFDVQLGERINSRAAMIETWLKMPVGKQVLARRIALLSRETLERVRNESVRLAHEGGTSLNPEDPRMAFREDERMRVTFAMAATGESIELPAEPAVAGRDDSDEPAFRLKRGELPARWRRVPAPPAAAAGEYRVLQPVGAGPSPGNR